MTRLQKILTGLLVMQVLITVVIYWQQRDVQAESEFLLADLQEKQAVAITIFDAEGRSIDLTREGGQWIVDGSDGFPAENSEIDDLLEALGNLRSNRLVTQTEASHERLQIADDSYVRLVRLTLDDDTVRSIYLGSSANPRATHVRVAGQDAVYLAGDISAVDVSSRISDWIDTSYVNLPRDSITALTLENENGVFVFQKSAEDEWEYEGLADDETFDPARLESLLSRLSALNMSEPLGKAELPAYRINDPQAVLTVAADQGDGSQTYTLLVGANDAGDSTYVVKWSDNDYYVKLTAFQVQDMVETTHEDFLAEPEPVEEQG